MRVHSFDAKDLDQLSLLSNYLTFNLRKISISIKQRINPLKIVACFFDNFESSSIGLVLGLPLTKIYSNIKQL